jgi:hypothetical protein
MILLAFMPGVAVLAHWGFEQFTRRPATDL